MFTASTMAAAFEAMGMALPGSSSHPAVLPEKRAENTISDVKKADCEAAVVARTYSGSMLMCAWVWMSHM